MPERLVVIGGDAAGMSAASQARRRRGREDLDIVAFERGEYTSYSACGIPYLIGGVVREVDALVTRSPEEHIRRGIDVMTHHEVTSIDTEARKVTVRDLRSGDEFEQDYDQLLIATGATPLRPDLPNSEAAGIFGMQTLGDGIEVRRALEEHEPRRAVVVGGGYIGLEMAEAFLLRGLEVTVVDRLPQPMNTLDPDMGILVAERMREMGVEVLCDTSVQAFEVTDGRVTAVVAENNTIPADIVTLGLGARPNVALAQAAGIPVGTARGVVVDRRMRTPVERVWAAGDCVEKFHKVARHPVAIALGTHANKEGRVAGINLGGGYATFPGVVGTAVSRVCELEVARTGLKENQARRAGYAVVTEIVDSTTRAGYFPGGAPIKTKMIVERNSGRLLGAQIVGKEGAAKRIDVIATALWNDMTVDEMLNMDLSYAPPFSPVWDPVLITARKAWQKVEENLQP